MITLNLSPQQHETICIALKIANNFQEMNDVMFMSPAFRKVYDEINLDETASQEMPDESKNVNEKG